jgi:hypothetical protein
MYVSFILVSYSGVYACPAMIDKKFAYLYAMSYEKFIEILLFFLVFVTKHVGGGGALLIMAH